MAIKIWAKSKSGDIEVSLPQHINDVLEAFNHLKPYVKSLSGEDISVLIETVIKYHDAGKILPYFQIRTLKNPDYEPFEVYTNIPHSLLSALLVDKSYLQEKLFQQFGDKKKAETYTHYVLSAIAYHHWRESFFDIIEGHADCFEQLNKLVSNKEKWVQIIQNLEAVYSEVKLNEVHTSLNQKWLEGLVNGIRFADYVTPPYQLYRMPKRIEIESSNLKDWILISGFIMLSDHFASYVEGKNEKDVSLKDIEIVPLNTKSIKNAIEKELKEKIGSSYDPNKIWQFNHIEDFRDKNTILLAPTGMGKTEFAFLWSSGKKFFYTLPLRAAVNQIYERTKKIFGENLTGILHSDADVYIYGEGGEAESMKIYETARQLSIPANISTGDQFFPYALRPPSFEKIFAKFSYSGLVIDEVQAYDPKAAAIVVKFIEHVVQMGGKFLLMTATLPGFIKKELEIRLKDELPKTLDLFEIDNCLQEFWKHKLNIKIDEFKGDTLSYSQNIIQNIIDTATANNGQRVLVVLNTIKQAQSVYKDLKKNGGDEVEVKLFHSRYAHSRRKKIEDSLEKFIGNNDDSRKDKRPKILVATQVVEASLDLDADYLFTELAPWDSMIQRMGRIFRAYRTTSPDKSKMIKKRYNDKEIPENVFVLIYNGKNKSNKVVFESGQGYVYHQELLQNTLKLLEEKDKDFDAQKLNEFSSKNNPAINISKLQKSFNKSSLVLTESSKNVLVQSLFNGLPDNSKYLSTYYGMLQILDAGFMSDRKNEAQKIFREINDVNVIPESKKDDFLGKIRSFNFHDEYLYTRFKKDIISKFVVSIQRNKVNEFLYETNLASHVIELNEVLDEPKNLGRLRKWLYGIYFVDIEYNDKDGFVGVNDLKGANFF